MEKHTQKGVPLADKRILHRMTLTAGTYEVNDEFAGGVNGGLYENHR